MSSDTKITQVAMKTFNADIEQYTFIKSAEGYIRLPKSSISKLTGSKELIWND